MIKPNYFALSFVGRRSSNQDSFLTLKLNDTSYFIAVADGMGGATSGHVASQTVLKEAKKFLKWAFAKDPNPKNLNDILKQTFTICQKAVADAIRNNPELSGMGTTLACVLICGNRVVCGNIGDSRVYKFYNNNFNQITEDHTYIQDYLKKEGGVISPEIQAQYSSFLTRSIDGGEDTPDIFPAENEYDVLLPGTAFLVCSDGLILDKSETDTSLLKELYLGTKSLKKAAENMISHAFQAGSSDNITVALFEYDAIPGKKNKRINYKYPPEEKSPTRKAPTPKHSPMKMLIAATMLLFLVILTVIIVKTSGFNIKSKLCINEGFPSETQEKIGSDSTSIQKLVIGDGNSDRPKRLDAPLNWSWDGEPASFIVFFYMDSTKKQEILKREVQKGPIYLKDFKEIKPESTYYWRVQALMQNGKTVSSELKKIHVGLNQL